MISAMPWHIEADNADCAGWAVVKDDDASIAGCHDTQAEAEAQMAALYANEDQMTAAVSYDDPPEDEPVALEPDPYEGMAEVPVYGVLALEGVETGDMPRREFAPGALTWAPFPISFKWQEREGDEHQGACVVGRIDAGWRDGALMRWVGAIDNVGEYGRELLRLRRSNFVRGVSIKADDLDRTDIEMIYPAPLVSDLDEVEVLGDKAEDGEEDLEVEGSEDFHYPGKHNQKDHGYGKGGKGKASNRQKAAAAKRIKARGDRFLSGDRAVDGAVTADGAAFEVLDDDPNLLPDDGQNMGFDMGMMEPVKLIFHAARIRSATVVAEPAFVEATFDIGESPIPVPMQTNPGTPDQMPEEVVVASASEQTCGTIDPNWRGGPTLVAGASYTITIPEVWPETWFEEPTDVPPIGALNITAAGRVYGYLAPAGVTHRGFRGRKSVYAPTRIDYSEFQNKGCLVASADGQVYKINAGNVTFDCGHASPIDPRRQDPSWAAAHYENSCSIAARVRVGENRNGTWVAGALLHGITPDAVERMMACALSGDWQDGKLKGALLVPVEGFPRAQTASVRVRADEDSEEFSMVASAVPVRFEAAEETVTLSRDVYDSLVAAAFDPLSADTFARYADERFDEIASERG